jgi:hypothetical protein
LRERGRESVREAEMRVRFGQGGGYTEEPGREHHRAGDVTASPEDDVRSPPTQDPHAGDRRAACEREPTKQRRSEATREPADAKGVERVPGLRDEPRLDAVRRAGERDADAAPAQRVGDRERGQDVAGRPPGCDQAREWSLRRSRH